MVSHFSLPPCFLREVSGGKRYRKSPVVPFSNLDEHFEQNKKAFKDMKNIPEGFVVQISGQLVP
jgi:hypothetical protein